MNTIKTIEIIDRDRRQFLGSEMIGRVFDGKQGGLSRRGSSQNCSSPRCALRSERCARLRNEMSGACALCAPLQSNDTSSEHWSIP